MLVLIITIVTTLRFSRYVAYSIFLYKYTSLMAELTACFFLLLGEDVDSYTLDNSQFSGYQCFQFFLDLRNP